VPIAIALYDYLQGPTAKQILRNHGYSVLWRD
jgi:ABC-type molybdate transport system substrate-binding protein